MDLNHNHSEQSVFTVIMPDYEDIHLIWNDH